MKHWFKDQHFRSLLKNSSYLAVSRDGCGGCAASRPCPSPRTALGVLLFGALILITSYAKAVSGISQVPVVAADRPLRRTGARTASRRFQDFDRLRLRARRGQRRRRDARRRRGPAVRRRAGSGSPADHLWLGDALLHLAADDGRGDPDGVLRALDRFDLISWQGTATPIGRAILVAIAYRRGAPFAAYVAAWYVTDLAGDLYPLVPRLARAASGAACSRASVRRCGPRAFPAPGGSPSTST